MSGDPAAAREWRAAYERVRGLLAGATDEQRRTRVPACPEWTVHDLLSHVVGLDRDVLDDHEDDDHNPGWTGAQVAARRDRSTDAVLAEWADLADALTTYLAERDVRPLGDLVIHEQDLRGALGVPGARDTAGLASITDAMAGRFGAAVTDAGLAPVRLESDDWSWASAQGEPGVVLRADRYDLFRALTSRRTADQLRSWVVSGEVEPYLAVFGALGSLPDRPLPE